MHRPLVRGVTMLPPARAALHALPTPALALALEGTLVAETDDRVTGPALVLPRGVPHVGEASGVHVIALLDDRHPIVRAFADRYPAPSVAPAWARELARALSTRCERAVPGVLSASIDEALRRAHAAEGWPASVQEPRVHAALDVLERAAREGVAPPRPLLRGVSPGHLRALVTRATGAPPSQHLLRFRLLSAVNRVADGDSITAAALRAGFADGAHLSRTARRAFGMTLVALRSAHRASCLDPAFADAKAPRVCEHSRDDVS